MAETTFKRSAARLIVLVAILASGGGGQACFFPGMPCIDDTFETVYDAAFVISPIVHDFSPIKINVQDFFEEVAEGNIVDFAVDLAVAEVTGTINDAVNCMTFLSGQPTCSTLGSVQACVNTALTAAPAVKKSAKYAKLATAKKQKYESGLSALKRTNTAVEKVCGDACEGGRCSGSTKEVKELRGCRCQEMEAVLNGAKAQTPSTCAYGMAKFDGNGKLVPHTQFSYFGCYIGTYDDGTDDDDVDSCLEAQGLSSIPSYSKSAGSGNTIYKSSLYPNGVMMRCEDEDGKQRATGTGGTGGSGSGVLRSVALAQSLLVACALMLFI